MLYFCLSPNKSFRYNRVNFLLNDRHVQIFYIILFPSVSPILQIVKYWFNDKIQYIYFDGYTCNMYIKKGFRI